MPIIVAASGRKIFIFELSGNLKDPEPLLQSFVDNFELKLLETLEIPGIEDGTLSCLPESNGMDSK